MTLILSILNRFKIFFTGRLLGKFAVKWISKIPPHLAYVATLPCETLMSAKQAIPRLLAVCWPSARVHEKITFLLVTLANIHRL